MVGKFVYEGIKAFLVDFFEPGKKYTKDYIKKAFDNFYDETGMRLEFYGDDYDMVTFMRNKIYLISRNEKGEYYLNEEGERFRRLLLSNEERFKVELLKWIYKHSRTRFRSLFVLIERLKTWLEQRGEFISTEEFKSLVNNVLGKHKFNEGVLSLIESLDLVKKVVGGYELNRAMFASVLSKEEELKTLYSMLKSLSINNKIMYRDAVKAIGRELGVSEKESEKRLKELEKSGFLIIRSTRGGKYIEF
jgi:hypothetical protein